MKVTLHEQARKGGKLSLYLDIYPPVTHPIKGTPTRRHFLKQWVHEKPKTKKEKDYNKAVFDKAEESRSEIHLKCIKSDYSFLSEGKKQSFDFISYLEERVNKKRGEGAVRWVTVLRYVKYFTYEVKGKKSLPVEQVDSKFVTEFSEFMVEGHSLKRITSKNTTDYTAKLGVNTKKGYLDIFYQWLKIAYNNKVISANLVPDKDEKPLKRRITKTPKYLTVSQVDKLEATPCSVDEIKKLAMFLYLTGLRVSDAAALTWRKLQRDDEGNYSFTIKIKKTQNEIKHFVSPEAVAYCGTPGKPDAEIFGEINVKSAVTYSKLKNWGYDAGINFPVKWHTFRHTYSMHHIKNGTKILTLSELLGHSSVGTTMAYLKVEDEDKINAAATLKVKK